MNTEQLKKIKLTETAKEIVHVLALRERNAHETDLGRFKNHLMRQGFKIVQDEYLQFFKELETANVGHIERRHHRMKFSWNYALIDVGKAMVDPVNHKHIAKLTANVLYTHNKNLLEQAKAKIASKASAPTEILVKETPKPSLERMVYVFTGRDGNIVKVEAKDMDQLLEQMKKVKDTLSM